MKVQIINDEILAFGEILEGFDVYDNAPNDYSPDVYDYIPNTPGVYDFNNFVLKQLNNNNNE